MRAGRAAAPRFIAVGDVRVFDRESVVTEALSRNRICALEVVHNNPAHPDLVREQFLVIDQVLEHNEFEVVGKDCGPYALCVSLAGPRFVLRICTRDGVAIVSHHMSMAPFRRIIHDYAQICEAHIVALAGPAVHRVEALDMSRRAIHDDAAEFLRERLFAKVRVNKDTARNLFTLMALPQIGPLLVTNLG